MTQGAAQKTSENTQKQKVLGVPPYRGNQGWGANRNVASRRKKNLRREGRKKCTVCVRAIKEKDSIKKSLSPHHQDGKRKKKYQNGKTKTPSGWSPGCKYTESRKVDKLVGEGRGKVLPGGCADFYPS